MSGVRRISQGRRQGFLLGRVTGQPSSEASRLPQSRR